ncbi:MAG TPA: SGNH/GDSL hydrolase family protein [Candidatus Limnocylindria bacterium]|nr:SGNH/GDSL hydrolase family protein [Candidatus Limnocylindria bacterium]
MALGDSYTIGTSVSEAECWPNQLVDRLADLEVELVDNLGVNGYTSADVIDEELPRLARLNPELVSLQIGVNDVVQGVPDDRYGASVSQILDTLLESLPADRAFAIATPDYTVTPQGAAYGVPELQRAGILHVNEILRGACEQRGIAFVPDIFEISAAAAADPQFVSGDGLHPSGAQYARWVDAIEPVVRAMVVG